jgi:hypothetical protein
MNQSTPTDETRGCTTDEAQLASLADEFVRRYRAGEQPMLDEYAEHHPALASMIRDLFPAMIALEPRPGLATTLDPTPPAERVGAMIGRYKLLERIGEGGFGVVYMPSSSTPSAERSR